MTIENIPGLFEQGFDRLSRTLYTTVPAILESVDGDWRGTVSHQAYPNVSAEDVPIWQAYAGDGYGEEHALHPPEMGVMLCLNYPMDEMLREAGHLDGISQRRHHEFEDGVFIPSPRTAPEARPDPNKPVGEYLYAHQSGTERRISETGDLTHTHAAGHQVELTDTDATLRYSRTGTNHRVQLTENTAEMRLGKTGSNHAVSLSTGEVSVDFGGEHDVTITGDGISATYTRNDGQTVDLDISGDEVTLSVPDEENDQATNPRSELGLASDGTATVDGRAEVGDSDAYREDRTTDNTDASDPRWYVQTDEPNAPIQDPSDDTETAYDNSSAASLAGPVDFGLFEFRNAVVERRLADPDPIIEDRTDPAFIDIPQWMRGAGLLPIGYLYILTSPIELKIIGGGGSPVTIQQL